MIFNGIVTIIAKNIVTNELIPEFKFIVNKNNVGDPQIELPEEERNPDLMPSLKPGESYSPVIAIGDSNSSSITLSEDKYLVSILANGYKMSGEFITISAGSNSELIVYLYPNPLSLSKIRVHVFYDNKPVNGEDDVPLETGLENFLIILDDALGEVTVDYFGNPLGTQYERDETGNLIFQDGNPTPIPSTGGRILTDENGDVLIDNLPPGKYGVQAIPPDGLDWIQTTTIEGTHVIDVWIEEGNDGYSPREGFKAPIVWFGFVRPMTFTDPVPWETGTITGTVKTVIEFTPPLRPLTLGKPIDRPWISLCDIGANDQQVYTGRGESNGYFSIEKIPPGTYQMAIWDEPLDSIISFRTVQVTPGELIEMGDIGIPRWYGYIEGTVFNDINENGIYDGELSIPNVGVTTRFKDGSIQYSTITDMKGHYLLNEVFELERFAVAEIGFTRLGATVAIGTPDYGIESPTPTGCMDNSGKYVRCSTTYDGALTLAELTWAAKTNKIDFGKKVYQDGENGGISGIVYYATMRNEVNPRFAEAEDYEPGIPHVTIKLYSTREENGQIVEDEFIIETTTDAWEHPTGCEEVNKPCLEVPNNSNQIKPGLFDGGYAFESLSSGVYIVEVVPPLGYKAIDKCGSTNTSDGDHYILDSDSDTIIIVEDCDPIDHQKSSFVPPYYLPPSSTEINIYKKVVEVKQSMNSAADFFLYTDVPVPGRIVGFLLDDVNIETDPNFIYYGEKRGIPNTPIGIRDFSGRLITTIYSDKNGIFEVLLPSTYTRNVPTPSGVVPSMYQVIGNDPGDVTQPNINYNPNYQTLKMVFDVWPGKTTYADVALFPITAFVGTPGSQFSQPPKCELEDDDPQIFRTNRIQVNLQNNLDSKRTIKITGTGFGPIIGIVKLNNIEIPSGNITLWNNGRIEFIIPRSFSSGPSQLLITHSSGKESIIGITLHLRRRDEYWQNIIRVSKDGTKDYTTIQEAIDFANDGDIIAISPDNYYESPILYKSVKLQGYGSGGIKKNGTFIQGTVIDGRFILSYLGQWLEKLNSIDFDSADGIPIDQAKEISKGQVLTIVAKNGQFDADIKPQIDGLRITGARGEDGGGLYINAYCQYLVISNNLIQSNGGGFGGGITVGRAYSGDNHNDYLHIHNNRILNNGGISLAGGIGIFNGAHHYNIEYNQICGNYSAEYGGGISHFGLSMLGEIHHNRVEFNNSFDEGAGIFVGGEQPTPPDILTLGSGEVDIFNNLIRGNLANDDGGGIRLLQPREYRINIYNNMIVNNVSTDIGGGIALDDASYVVIINNTIAKNITTATAEDSDGLPHAAGLVSEMNSTAFQDILPNDAPKFSNPILVNNIFCDNRAGIFDQSLNNGTGGISGIGNYGESPNIIDLEVVGGDHTTILNPLYCSLTQQYVGGNHNLIVENPLFVEEYDIKLTAVAFNMEPDFKSVKIVTVTPEPIGDYHITSGSPVIDEGIKEITIGNETFNAPSYDFDDEERNQTIDIGADEYNNN